MPDAETSPVTDMSEEELGAEEFANALRDALGRLGDDAAIARELNYESPAPDDVLLVRETIMTYAGRIMLGEEIAKRVRTLCLDDAAWTDVDAMRKQIADAIRPLME